MNKAEEWSRDMENRIIQMTQSVNRQKTKWKNMKAIWDLWDNIKLANLHLIGIPEGEEKEKGIENIFKEVMAEIFPNIKDTDIKMEEAQRAPNKLNPNRHTPRHIIIKMAKVKNKERILKAAREKKSVYKETPIKLSTDFSTETLQARREWQDIWKEKIAA